MALNWQNKPLHIIPNGNNTAPRAIVLTNLMLTTYFFIKALTDNKKQTEKQQKKSLSSILSLMAKNHQILKLYSSWPKMISL